MVDYSGFCWFTRHFPYCNVLRILKIVTNDLMTLVDGYWFCLGFNHWFVSESG